MALARVRTITKRIGCAIVFALSRNGLAAQTYSARLRTPGSGAFAGLFSFSIRILYKHRPQLVLERSEHRCRPTVRFGSSSFTIKIAHINALFQEGSS
jgi:hypothetical protein